MFRSAHGEENVDVAIFIQIISPILDAHSKDGTDVFDSFGDGSKRKETKLDEIVMFCVDCSKSMKEPSDFEELADPGSENSDNGNKELASDDLDVAADHIFEGSLTQEDDSSDISPEICMTFGQMKGKYDHLCTIKTLKAD